MSCVLGQGGNVHGYGGGTTHARPGPARETKRLPYVLLLAGPEWYLLLGRAAATSESTEDVVVLRSRLLVRVNLVRLLLRHFLFLHMSNNQTDA